MKTVFDCRFCHKEIEFSDKVCPHCGRPHEQQHTVTKILVVIFLGVVILLYIDKVSSKDEFQRQSGFGLSPKPMWTNSASATNQRATTNGFPNGPN
jgi:hypothetical protein